MMMTTTTPRAFSPLHVVLFLITMCSLPAQWLAQDYEVPYFIHQCSQSDPRVDACLTEAANHLARCFRRGIPELGVTEVEPIYIDEISIALGSGPDGYRAQFRDIEAFGVSNLTVVGVRTDLDTLQFQLSFFVPSISVRAHYRSSGVLIMVKASGGGDYWGEYEGVKAKVYFRAQPLNIQGHTFLQIQDIKMDFAIRDIKMGIENLHNGNDVIKAALNLFINSNSQELLQEMKPDIKKKMMQKMKAFMNHIFQRIPYGMWITE